MDISSEISRIFTQPAQAIFTLWDVLINLSCATILIFIIGYTYIKTHKGTSYAQYYVHTLFVMGLVTATIMMIIGSNIARAFTLVGALSIIRFRTAVKDVRDTGFIFFAIAAGMACGTQFYLVGVSTTIFISVLIFLLSWADYGKKVAAEKIIKIELSADLNHDDLLSDIFRKNLKYWSLIHTERFIKEGLAELSFIVIFKKKASEDDFLKQVGDLSGTHKVQLLYNDQKVEI